MNQISPDLAARPAAPVLTQTLSLSTSTIGLDPDRIKAAIATKRAQIAALEFEWSSASERAAARSLSGAARLGDRETWDRATWDRYLSAASDCQDTYLPKLRRLYTEITRLEQLSDPLPISRRRAA
jgi:hypothetical protein